MNAVGIDVSKGKSMVAIMRPFGEIVSTPFEIKHTASDIHSLVELINSVEGESRIVMEHTGRYYEVLAHQLSEANLFVSAINPKLIKDFDNDSLRKVKSDKADAVKIARYALDKWQNLKQYNVMDELRNQLKTMNRQFGFYMKFLSASLTKPILVLILYFDSPARPLSELVQTQEVQLQSVKSCRNLWKSKGTCSCTSKGCHYKAYYQASCRPA